MKKIIPFVVWLVYRLWTGTWRKTLIEPIEMQKLLTEKKPVIFAMWHQNELAMIPFCDHYKLGTLTSTSQDGELMDSVLKKLGFETARGSSTRGGVSALKGLVRMSQRGLIPVVPVDGPKGPIYQPKPGVFELSKLTNAHIIPGGVYAPSSLHFKKSWNRAFFPLPFSRVFLVWGKPLSPIQKNEDPRSPELCQKLKLALDAAGQEATRIGS